MKKNFEKQAKLVQAENSLSQTSSPTSLMSNSSSLTSQLATSSSSTSQDTLADQIAERVYGHIKDNVCFGPIVAREKGKILDTLNILRPSVSKENKVFQDFKNANNEKEMHEKREAFHKYLVKSVLESFYAYVQIRGSFPSIDHLNELVEDIVERSRNAFNKSFK